MLALFEKKKYMKEKTRALTKLMSPSLLTMPQVQWKRFAAMVRSLVDSHYVCWVLLADCAGSARPGESQHSGQDPKVHTLVKRLQCCRESSKKKKPTVFACLFKRLFSHWQGFICCSYPASAPLSGTLFHHPSSFWTGSASIQWIWNCPITQMCLGKMPKRFQVAGKSDVFPFHPPIATPTPDGINESLLAPLDTDLHAVRAWS